MVSLAFDGEIEFVAWKRSPSKDSRITFIYHSVQRQSILPQLCQILYQGWDVISGHPKGNQCKSWQIKRNVPIFLNQNPHFECRAMRETTSLSPSAPKYERQIELRTTFRQTIYQEAEVLPQTELKNSLNPTFEIWGFSAFLFCCLQ